MPTTPHPITKEKVPLTIGHEFSATVEEVGQDIDDLEVGSRVVIQPIIYDGTCNACKEGLINSCDTNGFIGLSGRAIRNVHNRNPLIYVSRMGRWTLRARSGSSRSRFYHPRQYLDGSWR